MDSIVSTMENMVSISDFNKGEAGKIFGMVKSTKQAKLVLRRNEPECVLISPETYTALMQELEDLRDFKLATERLISNSGTISWEDALKEIGVSSDVIDSTEDIEFE